MKSMLEKKKFVQFFFKIQEENVEQPTKLHVITFKKKNTEFTTLKFTTLILLQKKAIVLNAKSIIK